MNKKHVKEILLFRFHPSFAGPKGALFIFLVYWLFILSIVTQNWSPVLAQNLAGDTRKQESISSHLESRRPPNRAGKSDSAKKTYSEKKKTEEESIKEKGKGSTAKEEEGLFLPEATEDQTWLPEIYRCPECGYEQDEPGFCPDHEKTELVKVLAKGENPLAPPELDGNEDLIVDIPLTGLVLRRLHPSAATEPANLAGGSPIPTSKPPRR